MDAIITAEADLNALVKEYLEYMSYTETSNTFDKERTALGKTVNYKAIPPRNDQQKFEIERKMLDCMDKGNYMNFFAFWREHIPSSLQDNDPICQKLEFRLNIYFAIFPILQGSAKNDHKLEKSMKNFKSYLETRGSVLSQTSEFLPYYALPYIPDPQSNSSFKPLFTSEWSRELRVMLSEFLTSVLKSQAKPQLYDVYKNGTTALEKEKKQAAEQVRALQRQVSDAEYRTQQVTRRMHTLQRDYHKLIGVAAELVDSLEDTVRGKMVTPEYLQDICFRLFAPSIQDSVDITKPGTASSMLRASVANLQGISMSEPADSSNYPALDFEKVKHDLVNADRRRQGFLLQAVRWRLTQAQSEEQRKGVMMSYVSHDLLGCKYPGSHTAGVLELFESVDHVVVQYVARLTNAFASLSEGRTYLALNEELVITLQNTLMSNPKDQLTCENILGTLQKLSLRRRLQSLMIHHDLISWLINTLEDYESLSDYMLEYSVALLMNLCLRSAGKRRCIPDARHKLKVISDLLGHENTEIRPYVNGALYSIFALPDIKEVARAMGMEDILKCFLTDDGSEMSRQIQFVIRQLASDKPPEEEDPDSDNEDDEDDDSEGDAIDAELDKEEELVAQGSELWGEKLLAAEYSTEMLSASTASLKPFKKRPDLAADHPLTRPTTPGARPLTPREPVIKQDPAPLSRPGTTTIRPASQSRSHAGSRPGTGHTIQDEGEITPRPESSPGGDVTPRPLSNTRGASSRPHTSSGSRPSSRKPQPEETTNEDEKPTTSQNDPKNKIFASRPKIPRTPEPASEAATSRPGTSSPPPPVRSGSPPPHRPTSGGSRQGSAASKRGSSAASQSGKKK